MRTVLSEMGRKKLPHHKVLHPNNSKFSWKEWLRNETFVKGLLKSFQNANYQLEGIRVNNNYEKSLNAFTEIVNNHTLLESTPRTYNFDSDVNYLKLQNVKGGGTYKMIFPKRDDFIKTLHESLKNSGFKVLDNNCKDTTAKLDELYHDWYTVGLCVKNNSSTYISVTTSGAYVEVGLRNFSKEINDEIITKVLSENDSITIGVNSYNKGTSKWWYFVRKLQFDESVRDKECVDGFINELESIKEKLEELGIC